MVGNTCEYSNDNYKYHREEGSARAPYVARMFLVSERSMAGVTTVSSKEDGVDDLLDPVSPNDAGRFAGLSLAI